MPVAFTMKEFEYVVEEDRKRPEKDQTRFRLRTLTVPERAECERTEFSQVGEEINLVSDQLERAQKVLGYALLGWSNFCDENGDPVEFSEVKEHGRRIVPVHIYNRISPWMVELANEVTRRSRLSEDAAKNSGAP